MAGAAARNQKGLPRWDRGVPMLTFAQSLRDALFPRTCPKTVNSLHSVGRVYGLHRYPSAPPLHFGLARVVCPRWHVRLGAGATCAGLRSYRWTPIAAGTFHGFCFTTPSLRKPTLLKLQRCGRGLLMCTVGSTNRTPRIDRLGQLRGVRESRSDWAKVRIGNRRPQRGRQQNHS